MRTRALVAGALIGVVLMTTPLGAAYAQTTTTGAHAEPKAAATESTPTSEGSKVEPTSGEHKAELSHVGECVEKAVEAGTDPADCQKAPNPILPATTEILWGTASFLVLFVAMAKFGYPAVRKGMEDRSEKIRGDLQRAEDVRVEAEAVLADYESRVSSSKAEATRIIEDARATADSLKADLQKRAEAEIAEMRQRAAADIEAAKVQAISDLRGEVAALAIGAAEVVVQKNLDQATQIELIENYINSVGSAN